MSLGASWAIFNFAWMCEKFNNVKRAFVTPTKMKYKKTAKWKTTISILNWSLSCLIVHLNSWLKQTTRVQLFRNELSKSWFLRVLNFCVIILKQSNRIFDTNSSAFHMYANTEHWIQWTKAALIVTKMLLQMAFRVVLDTFLVCVFFSFIFQL